MSGFLTMLIRILLLVSVSPPRCSGTWMWFAVTRPGGPEDSGCERLSLSVRQRDLCLSKPQLVPGIRAGARLARGACQLQFRHERWNCSTPEEAQLSRGTRETAFVQAVMAAGLVHAVTRSCSQGNVSECGCDSRLGGGGGGSAEGAWSWGGCSDHIRYGTWFSRRFLGPSRNTSTSRGGYTLESMNQHNTEAGRQAIDRTMSTDCRCHGVSGSCAVKTCWRTMAPFERVGVYLKERYERGVQVWDGSPRKTRRKERRPVDKHQLLFINKSPNYCLEDRRRGVPGTRGRRCSRTSTGPDGCNLLCCGRGYNTHVVRRVERCDCKFVWCCYVTCRRCESMNDLHTCK